MEQLKKKNVETVISKFYEVSGKHLDRQQIIKLEKQVIVKLHFNFNFSNPEHFISRFLRIIGFRIVPSINESSI